MTNNTKKNTFKYEVGYGDVSSVTVAKQAVPERVVRSTVQWADDMAQSYQIGPRVLNNHPMDGASAMVRAVEAVFGGKMTGQAIPPSFMSPGQLPEMRTLAVQTLVYAGPDNGAFRRSDLDRMPMAQLVSIASQLGFEVPRYYSDADRAKLISGVCDTAEIIGLDKEELTVPWGLLNIFDEDGQQWGQIDMAETDEGLFQVTIVTRKANEERADALMRALLVEVRDRSIYKGLAYSFSEREFMHYVDPNMVHDLALEPDQETQIKGQILNRIKFRDKISKVGPRLQKATILLPGKYGTGKTMSMNVVSWFAIKNRWSVVKYVPAMEKEVAKEFGNMLRFAASMGPSLIVIEDVEKMIPANDEEAFSRLLEDLDGMSSKGHQVITLMTTNYPDRIPKAIWRRFHGVIPFEDPSDTEQVIRLIKIQAKQNLASFNPDDPDLRSTLYDIEPQPQPTQDEGDWNEVAGLMIEHGFSNWLIAQAVSRAEVYALPQEGDSLKVRAEDVLYAAQSLLPQYAMYQGAGHGPSGEKSLDTRISDIITEVMNKGSVDREGQFHITK